MPTSSAASSSRSPAFGDVVAVHDGDAGDALLVQPLHDAERLRAEAAAGDVEVRVGVRVVEHLLAGQRDLQHGLVGDGGRHGDGVVGAGSGRDEVVLGTAAQLLLEQRDPRRSVTGVVERRQLDGVAEDAAVGVHDVDGRIEAGHLRGPDHRQRAAEGPDVEDPERLVGRGIGRAGR